MYHTLYTGGNGPIAEKYRRKPTNEDKKCWDGNSHAASGTVFRISKFKDADRNVTFYFFKAFFWNL
jgi:hypothetical protein